jgi:hypothetical protein
MMPTPVSRISVAGESAAAETRAAGVSYRLTTWQMLDGLSRYLLIAITAVEIAYSAILSIS